jgi:hypothetical protein
MRATITGTILLAVALLVAGCLNAKAGERRLADPTPWDWIFDDSNRGTGWRDPGPDDQGWRTRPARAPGRADLSGVSECEYPCGAIQ